MQECRNGKTIFNELFTVLYFNLINIITSNVVRKIKYIYIYIIRNCQNPIKEYIGKVSLEANYKIVFLFHCIHIS